MSNHGGTLMKYHNGSPWGTLKSVYSDYIWLPWRFDSSPKGLWSKGTADLFIESFALTHNVVRLSDWYRVQWNQFVAAGGKSLFENYFSNHPVSFVLSSRMDYLPLRPWRFLTLPKRLFTAYPALLEACLDETCTKLSITRYFQLYNVSFDDLAEETAQLLRMFQSSPYLLLRSLYAAFSWQIYYFAAPPKHLEHLSADVDVGVMLRHVESELDLNSATDWQRVSQAQLKAVSPTILRIINLLGGLPHVLALCYPGTEWNADHFRVTQQGRKAAQRSLVNALNELFPGIKQFIIEDFIHSGIIYDESKAGMQLDLFIPELMFALEYQGEQHYSSLKHFGKSEKRKLRDKEKHVKCQGKGISLCSVPYWWNGSASQLFAIIEEQCSDVLERIATLNTLRATSNILSVTQ